ncbi:MAG: hypothetical protein NTW28_21725, partial [Candidatus Solibacter sp.]|nr:hypothetical protein [Candidatus Solibacter sp.]
MKAKIRDAIKMTPAERKQAKIVSAGIRHPQFCRLCRFAPPSAWAGTLYVLYSSVYIFPFHTALSSVLRSWNPFRFLRRRIDRDPLLSVLPAKLSSIPVPTSAARLQPARVPA